MTELITTKLEAIANIPRKTPVLHDSLPEELERLLVLDNVDWSGQLIGRSEMNFNPIPVIAKKSSAYIKIIEWIDLLENSLTPAKPKQIFVILAQVRLHMPMINISEYEAELLIKDYIVDLAEFPLDLIIQVCNEYRYNPHNQFFPKIAQLLALIDPHIRMRKHKLKKLKKILEVSNAKTTITQEKSTKNHNKFLQKETQKLLKDLKNI